ncbi:MAG: folylpolyglutamate synthase/dihydrofolate synthase family protein [Bacillota bacterium]
MTYEEAVDYIQNAAAAGIRPGLERIRALAARLGNPQQRLKCVHVGGTNGKGSVCAMLTAMLVESGYKVGTFTSPHLHSYTERFRINGRDLPPERFGALAAGVRPELEVLRAGGVIPTEFEIHAALAFLYFNEEAVDVAVVEVGLGGRYDATNIISPEVAVITNVTVDHTDYLGDSILQIAGEKAGIIKHGTPVVTAAVGEALEVIEQACRAKNAPLFVSGRDFYPVGRGAGLSGQKLADLLPPFSGQEFDVYGWWGADEGLRIRLLGRHQLKNAACAVAAVRLLEEQGRRLGGTAVRAGLASAVWPGRLEVVRDSPLVILDGAHNAAGAAALKNALEDYFPGRRLVLVLGMLADKERSEAAAKLCPLAAAVVVTRPPGSRAGNWRELAGSAREHAPRVYEIEDIPAAVSQAVTLAGPKDLVVVTGSLYLIAEARAVLRDNKGPL